MPKKPKQPEQSESSKKKVLEELAAVLRREVLERVGRESTFEQRRDVGLTIMTDVLWKDADDDLQESVSDAAEVEVGDKLYRRMEQASSATYDGRWGPHRVAEALYREVGVHNGPTIKPIELRVGIIEHMTPDMARVVGALSAQRSSRARTLPDARIQHRLGRHGVAPPNRRPGTHEDPRRSLASRDLSGDLQPAHDGPGWTLDRVLVEAGPAFAPRPRLRAPERRAGRREDGCVTG